MADRRRAIGDRIAAARLHANLTQDDAAAATGLDRRTIQRIERGETDARLGWLLLVADLVEVPLGVLISQSA